MGHGQVKLQYLFKRQSGACMPLRNQRMARQPLAPEQVGTQITMAQVMVFAKAVDLIGICKENSYIMKHGCLLDEWGIGPQFGVCSHNLQGLVGDKAASYAEALSRAAESIDSGRARAKLDAMLEAMK